MKWLAPRISARDAPALAGRRRTRHVQMTFDDAFACLLENALPVTCELGIPVTIFVPTSNLGRPPNWTIPPDHPETGARVMTSDEIRRVHRPGLVDFGSHTCTHPALGEIPMAAVAWELQESRQRLAELAGQPVDDLALPHGSLTPAVIEAAFAVGYQRVYTLEPTPHPIRGGRQVIGRFLMSPDAWRIEFLLTCAGAYAWLYSWRRLLRRLCGQRPVVALGGSALTPVATPGGTWPPGSPDHISRDSYERTGER